MLLPRRLEVLEARVEPMLGRVVHDRPVQLDPSVLLLRSVHGKGRIDGLGALTVVPWVDRDLALAKNRRAAGELAEDEGTVLLAAVLAVLAEDILGAGEVHPLAQARDHEGIGGGDHGKELRVLHVLLQEDKRLVRERRVLGVDPSHDVRDGGNELCLLGGRGRHLDEHGVLAELRMSLQEQLVRQELLAHTTNMVELVARDNKILASILGLDLLQPVEDLGVLTTMLDRAGVDADGEGTDVDEAILELDAGSRDLDVEQTIARLQEVVDVLLGLEADEVGAEHAVEQLGPHGQAPEDLGRRKGDVEEDTDLRLRQLLADHARDEQ